MIVWFSWICSICEIYWKDRTAGHLVFWKPWLVTGQNNLKSNSVILRTQPYRSNDWKFVFTGCYSRIFLHGTLPAVLQKCHLKHSGRLNKETFWLFHSFSFYLKLCFMLVVPVETPQAKVLWLSQILKVERSKVQVPLTRRKRSVATVHVVRDWKQKILSWILFSEGYAILKRWGFFCELLYSKWIFFTVFL